MAYATSEKIKTVTLNYAQLEGLVEMSYHMKQKMKNMSGSQLSSIANAAGIGATILGLVFVNTTPIGIASALVGIFTAVLPDEYSVYKAMVEQGYDQLTDIMYWYKTNKSKYDQIKIETSIFEFRNEGVAFPTAATLAAVHSNSGWQEA